MQNQPNDTRPADDTKKPAFRYAYALVQKDTVILVRHFFNDDSNASVSGLISELIERKSNDI